MTAVGAGELDAQVASAGLTIVRLLAVVEVAVTPWCATCDFEAGDRAPMRCGCLRAYASPPRGAAVGLPSRSTGFTALPLTWS